VVEHGGYWQWSILAIGNDNLILDEAAEIKVGSPGFRVGSLMA
jgi:hypothetical protein